MLPSPHLIVALLGAILIDSYAGDALPSAAASAPRWTPLAFAPFIGGLLLEVWLRLGLNAGRRPSRPWRLAFRLLGWASTAAFLTLVWRGQWIAFVRTAMELSSHALEYVVVFAPFAVSEVLRRISEQRIVGVLQRFGYEVQPVFGLTRLRELAFLTLVLVLPVLLDVVQRSSVIAAAITHVTLASWLLVIAYVLVLLLIAPAIFCFVAGTTRLASRWIEEELRMLARQIGFSFRRLLLWRTGETITNAGVIGVFRWNRYVLLTDGLLGSFEMENVATVFTHEAGHAIRHHVIHLLLVGIFLPGLALAQLVDLGWIEVDAWGLPTIGAAAVLLVASVLAFRWLSHRFEQEADLFSASAMGSSDPPIRALRILAEQHGHPLHRSSMRHPSLAKRIATLMRAEEDPAWLRRWQARGFWSLVLCYALAGALAGLRSYDTLRGTPIDLAALSVYTGHVESAEERVQWIAQQLEQAQQTRPTSWSSLVIRGKHDEERLKRLARSIEMVRSLAPGVTSPQERVAAVRRLAPRRAARALEKGDAEGASEWLDLAVGVGDAAPATRLLQRFCAAVQERDAAAVGHLRAHLAEILDEGRLRDAVEAVVARQS